MRNLKEATRKKTRKEHSSNNNLNVDCFVLIQGDRDNKHERALMYVSVSVSECGPHVVTTVIQYVIYAVAVCVCIISMIHISWRSMPWGESFADAQLDIKACWTANAHRTNRTHTYSNTAAIVCNYYHPHRLSNTKSVRCKSHVLMCRSAASLFDAKNANFLHVMHFYAV